MNNEKIKIYCDGACSGNQFNDNKGGWGAILLFKEKKKEIYGGEKNTTNQKMELTACIKALETIKTQKYPIEVYTDSAYLYNCIKQQWYKKWKLNGWKTSNKKDVKNRELWENLTELIEKYNPKFFKVQGHANNSLNEKADELANKGMQNIR